MTTPTSDRVFVQSVTLRNYKSIAACRVALRPLTFLVGPNGSGKSNFLDALRFVGDSLRTSLDHALRDRGTIKEVRRRSGGHPNHFARRIDFALPDHSRGHYSLKGVRVDLAEVDLEVSWRGGAGGTSPGERTQDAHDRRVAHRSPRWDEAVLRSWGSSAHRFRRRGRVRQQLAPLTPSLPSLTPPRGLRTVWNLSPPRSDRCWTRTCGRRSPSTM